MSAGIVTKFLARLSDFQVLARGLVYRGGNIHTLQRVPPDHSVHAGLSLPAAAATCREEFLPLCRLTCEEGLLQQLPAPCSHRKPQL